MMRGWHLLILLHCIVAAKTGWIEYEGGGNTPELEWSFGVNWMKYIGRMLLLPA